MIGSWLAGVRLSGGAIHYRQTGARIPIDAAFLRDVAAWFGYYAPLQVRAVFRRLTRPGPRICYLPAAPPPWYLLWNATAWIGARTVDDPSAADAIVYFEDATWVEGCAGAPSSFCINGKCLDVSKSRVASAFEQIFGYPLALDPRTSAGLAVEKSERNGAHDGRIVELPAAPTEGRVYQRLIETGGEDYVEDLRTPCVGGAPVAVFIKRRPRAQRFANFNTSVHLAEPEEMFSPEELARIGALARALALDWGGLDILRERQSGRLYVVDVNKTDMPPLALSFADKMKASARLGEALRKLIEHQR